MGGGRRSLSRTTTLSSSPQRVDNPYTISNLQFNCKVNSSINVIDTRPVITNMASYAENNIPNYNTIASIPSGHLPTDINTSLAQDWSNAFSYSGLFLNGINLTTVPDPFYDTSNATNMIYMFSGCSNLTTIPKFDTSNVTNMAGMFNFCSNLTTVPNFDTSNVTDMSSMFSWCFNLTTVPNFNTSNVTNMFGMLYFCRNLTTVPNFDTSNVTDMGYMFGVCENLTTVPNFDTSNVTNMSYMFYSCDNLTTIPNFDTSNVTDMSSMFENCINIKGALYIESNNVTDASDKFSNCSKYIKNIYCHAGTTTYNSIYNAMGNNTYNSNWNAYLLTMEDNYAHINWSGEGIYRFPTNKIQVMDQIIEVTPYTDYNLTYHYGVYHGNTCWCPKEFASTMWVNFFTFFKDIPNMTADVVDTI